MRFWKMQANGNDFLIFDFIRNPFPPSLERLTRLCDRRYGVGADDILLVSRSDIGDVKMQVLNPDGSIGALCGNGLRCVALFVWEVLGRCRPDAFIETDVGVKRARLLTSERCIETNGLDAKLLFHRSIFLSGRSENVVAVDVGVPHAVVFVRGLQEYPVAQVGPMIEHHPDFLPQTTNVMFVESNDEGCLSIRSWERGGTGESFACGTGAIAVAKVWNSLGRNQPSTPINLQFRGGTLQACEDNEGRFSLIGSAQIVFEGKTHEVW
ncbi:diaminopimelate epimerase [Sulfobacillus acidophilus DSM 10332]|uniref:Diaminopimelate epimerase n=1 Tax=Sulfobacillus acidophilus (strain ATCC 700253 / DSM 10332 / NAL) TaxID=679936 RepID=G8TZY6_SULAD|nr:diaminopimelate epimerase [Sulfobacillus acidophilus DSM 10332]